MIWKNLKYTPGTSTPEEDIIIAFEKFPALRFFIYYGTCNVVDKFSEYCRKIRVLQIPHIKLSTVILKLTMERLTELRELAITISITKEVTRIISVSNTLESLHLHSFGGNAVVKGLLKPTADGPPNVKVSTAVTATSTATVE